MRVSSFLQTPFVSYEDKNMVYITVEDWDFCNPYRVDIFVDEEIVYSERIFAPELSAMIPSYENQRLCVVRVTPFEDLPNESEYTIDPVKHFQIPLLYSSHEDLGYCAYVEKLHYECYEYLKKAIELCLKHSDFKYMIEHYWWLDAFDFHATKEEKLQLKNLMKEQRIELNAIHSGVHTSWANSEQLVRQMYFSCIRAREKYEASPKCAFYTDLSGADSSIINAYTKMGIKYVGFFANSFRNCKENNTVPPIFWWEDKTGESRVLLWHQRSYRPFGLAEIWCDTKRQYNEGEFYLDKTKMLKTEKWISQKISKINSYGYDIFPLSFYDDRELPTTMLLTVCQEMNKKWKYPKFQMEIPSVFMAELEAKFGEKIPTLRGEISDQWADFATIAPELTSKKREAMRMAYDAEIISVLDSIINKSSYDSKLFDDVYFKLSEFDEHCWATSSKHPQAMHRHNIQKVKKEPVEYAVKTFAKIMEKVQHVSDCEKISVISTIPSKRKNHIRVPKDTLIPNELEHQILPNGEAVTSQVELDGIGARTFDAMLPSKNSKEINCESFETDFYRVQINTQTKKLVSILDKETGTEYIDRGSKFELGQFVYTYTEHKTDSSLSYEVPKKLDLRVYEGDVAYVIAQRGYEEQSGATAESQFTFYKHERTIDVDLSYKNALGLIGDFYDRYKKNYFFAFPFKIENPEFYSELAVGEKNLKRDIIPLNANDFSVTQNWICAENENCGIAIYTRDMPVFHMGRIKFNQFNSDFNEDKSHIFLYASSNRCNNLIYTTPEQCQAKYHLSILTYNGKHNDIVPKWSSENEHRLMIGNWWDNESLLSLSRKNIRLTCIKKADDCDNAIVLRFVEAEGKATDFDLELFFKPTKVVYVTNDERELDKIITDGSTVHLKSLPYSYTAVKIYGEF